MILKGICDLNIRLGCPIVCSWFITETNSVLCASEDCAILQSIQNTSQRLRDSL